MARRRSHHRARSPIWPRLLRVLIVLLVALPLAAVALFAAIFDPNAHKPRLEAMFSTALHRSVQLRGPVGLVSWLPPALSAADVVVTTPQGADLLHAARVEARLALLPLLWGQTALARLSLTAPEFTLDTDGSGHGNWQAEAGSPIVVQGLDIQDGVMRWHGGTRITLAQLSAEAGGADSPVQFSGRIGVAGQMVGITGTTGPLARLLAHADGGPWALTVQAESQGQRVGFIGSLQRPWLLAGPQGRFQIRVDTIGALSDWLTRLGLVTLPDLPPLRDVVLAGQLTDIGADWPALSDMTLVAGESDLDGILPGLRAQAVEIRLPGPDLPVRASLTLDRAGVPLRVTAVLGAPSSVLPALGRPGGVFPIDVTFAMAGADLVAKGVISNPAHQAGLSVEIGGSVPDLAALGAALGLPMPAWRGVTLAGRLTDAADGYAQGVVLRDLRVGLAGGDITGGLALSWDSVRPLLRGDLTAGRLTADPSPILALLSPPARSGGLDLDLRASIAELTLPGLMAREVAGRLVRTSTTLALDPLTAQLPGGRLDARIIQDGNDLSLRVHAPGLPVQVLLAAAGWPEDLSGLADLDADLRASGDTPAALLATLDGRLGLAVTDGELRPRAMLASVQGAAKGLRVPPDLAARALKLRCLALRADILRGQASLGAGVLDAPPLLLQGGGSVNLARQSLALLMRAVVRSQPNDGGIATAFQLAGGWDAPVVTPLPPGRPLPAGFGPFANQAWAAERGGDSCPYAVQQAHLPPPPAQQGTRP